MEDAISYGRCYISWKMLYHGRCYIMEDAHLIQGRHFNFFLGAKIFLFFNATRLLKNWKKQHFICSNLTLFIVPFFPSSFFIFFFLFFFLLFLLFFFLGGDSPPSPPQMTPLISSVFFDVLKSVKSVNNQIFLSTFIQKKMKKTKQTRY